MNIVAPLCGLDLQDRCNAFKVAITMPAETKLCDYCDNQIPKPRKGKRYCNSKCRWSAWNARHPRINSPKVATCSHYNE